MARRTEAGNGLRCEPAGLTSAKMPQGSCAGLIPDNDIHRSAWLMIRRYGEDAAVKVAMRGDELLNKGDLDGMLIWQAVISAIRRLQATTPAGDEALHCSRMSTSGAALLMMKDWQASRRAATHLEILTGPDRCKRAQPQPPTRPAGAKFSSSGLRQGISPRPRIRLPQ
jgi:hypothetical protein